MHHNQRIIMWLEQTYKEGNENVKIVIEALEKQMPKKPTHEASLYRCCTCPKCKNVVDEFTDFVGQKVRVTYAYCRFCGQALDWSDT